MLQNKGKPHDPHTLSPARTFAKTFRSACASQFIFPLIQCVGLCGFIPLLVYLFDIRRAQELVQQLGEKAVPITQQYRFLLITTWEDTFVFFLIFFLALTSIFTGVAMFRVMTRKKSATVYYALGVSRKNLFLARYTAGLLLLGLSVLIPMAADVVLNLTVFGSSDQLWKAAAYDTLGLMLTSFLIFTITAAVCCTVGTSGEGLFFSLCAVCMPSLLQFSFQNLMERFVWGNPFGHPMEDFRGNSMVRYFSAWNPLFFMRKPLLQYRLADPTGSSIPDSFGRAPAPWEDPRFLTLLPWILVLLGLLAASLLIFRRRRAEICGFIGENKTCNAAAAFLIGLPAFSWIVSKTDSLPLALSILCGALVYFLIYAILTAVFMRSRKRFARGLVKLPIHFAAVALVLTVFATGLFGYAKRIPAVEEIDRVVMSSIGFHPAADGDVTLCNGSTYENDVPVLSGTILYDAAASEHDKELIRSLHQGWIAARAVPKEERLKTAVVVSYHLKNGKTLQRYYASLSEDAIASLYQVEETDALRNAGRRNVSAEPKPKQNTRTYQRNIEDRFGYETGTLHFLSPDLSVSTPSPLNRDAFIAIKQALIEDFNAQSSRQRYFTAEQALGVLYFQQNEEESYDKGPAASDDHLLANPYGSISYFVITPDMTRTVEFLKAHDLLGLFHTDNTVVKAQVLSAAETYQKAQEHWDACSPIYLFGASSTAVTSPNYDILWRDQSVVMTEPALCKTLFDRSLLQAYTGGTGYLIHFILSDGSRIVKYLPADRTPQVLTEKF